jgi:hypothetical protein
VPIIIQRQEAVANFQRYYFTGQPCKRGHIADRVTANSDCVECVRERQRGQSRAAEQNQLRAEYAARKRREMHHDDASSNVRRALMGLGHVMNAPEARERGRYLDDMIKSGANYIRSEN